VLKASQHHKGTWRFKGNEEEVEERHTMGSKTTFTSAATCQPFSLAKIPVFAVMGGMKLSAISWIMFQQQSINAIVKLILHKGRGQL